MLTSFRRHIYRSAERTFSSSAVSRAGLLTSRMLKLTWSCFQLRRSSGFRHLVDCWRKGDPRPSEALRFFKAPSSHHKSQWVRDIWPRHYVRNGWNGLAWFHYSRFPLHSRHLNIRVWVQWNQLRFLWSHCERSWKSRQWLQVSNERSIFVGNVSHIDLWNGSPKAKVASKACNWRAGRLFWPDRTRPWYNQHFKFVFITPKEAILALWSPRQWRRETVIYSMDRRHGTCNCFMRT